MEYRKLPGTDIEVPVLTLGTGTFGGSHGYEGWGHTDVEGAKRLVDILDEIAEETGHTVAQVALNWVLQRPTITSLVIGARTEEHLKFNLGATGWNLTPEQVKRLDNVSQRVKSYPYWHQDVCPLMKSQLF